MSSRLLLPTLTAREAPHRSHRGRQVKSSSSCVAYVVVDSDFFQRKQEELHQKSETFVAGNRASFNVSPGHAEGRLLAESSKGVPAEMSHRPRIYLAAIAAVIVGGDGLVRRRVHAGAASRNPYRCRAGGTSSSSSSTRSGTAHGRPNTDPFPTAGCNAQGHFRNTGLHA